MKLLLMGIMAVNAHATEWVGEDIAGADITVENGDHMSGHFTGVALFHVPGGATVFAQNLKVDAQHIIIDGVLTSDGLGSSGGVSSDGMGFGAGLTPPGGDGAGGGGGAHGGMGGGGGWYYFLDPGQGLGGQPFGEALLTSPAPGSGGGAGAGYEGAGGHGGGLIELSATNSIDLNPTGTISANGAQGGYGLDESFLPYIALAGGGGGGGAGGAIRLTAPAIVLEGDLLARGGNGGDGGPGSSYSAGGGGGGGRIAVSGNRTGAPTVDVAGGAGGSVWLPGEAGTDGTWSETTPEPCIDSDLDHVCDAVDQCLGQDDSGDADGDGHCMLDAVGAVADCDDADEFSYPGAPERCDGLDNACVGRLPADEADLDGDGTSMCEGDCDDLDSGDACTSGSGCSIGTSGPSSPAWLIVAALALGLRRRGH